MEPLLAKNDKQMFYKYLDNSKIYFEYGSGGSTYQASIRNNIINIYIQLIVIKNGKIFCNKQLHQIMLYIFLTK